MGGSRDYKSILVIRKDKDGNPILRDDGKPAMKRKYIRVTDYKRKLKAQKTAQEKARQRVINSKTKHYIDHYFCKSTQEFVNKLNKKDALYIDSNLRDRIKVYFAINKPTKEKKDYMKNHIITNISLDDLLT